MWAYCYISGTMFCHFIITWHRFPVGTGSSDPGKAWHHLDDHYYEDDSDNDDDDDDDDNNNTRTWTGKTPKEVGIEENEGIQHQQIKERVK
jgi:hypothetical protein